MNNESPNNAIFVSLEADNALLAEVSTYMAAMASQPNPHQRNDVQLLHFILMNGPLTRYLKLRVRMRRECRERFPCHRG